MKKFFAPTLLALVACATPAFAWGTFGLFVCPNSCCCKSGCCTICIRQYNAFTPLTCGCLNLTGPVPVTPCGGNGWGCPSCGNGYAQGPYFAPPTDVVNGNGAAVTTKEEPPPMKMPKVDPMPLPAPIPGPAPAAVQPTSYQGAYYAPPAYNPGYAPNYGYPAPGYYVPTMMANPYYVPPAYWNGYR